MLEMELAEMTKASVSLAYRFFQPPPPAPPIPSAVAAVQAQAINQQPALVPLTAPGVRDKLASVNKQLTNADAKLLFNPPVSFPYLCNLVREANLGDFDPVKECFKVQSINILF